MVKGKVLKVIDYGSSRKITNEQGEVGEMVGTAEFMGKYVFIARLIVAYLEIP